MIRFLMFCTPFVAGFFSIYCMFYLIENGQLPNFKREKNKKIRDLKKELRRVQQLEYSCYDWDMVKKYKKRINEIEWII